MPNKMLIDATHPEETRVIVLRGNRVEEFDFESADRKQLRGNIYLAKVTRVEPSLQAAFVEYGGNRHGFLAFSEIHPDYYQIPVADRQALLEEEARAERDDEDDEPRSGGGSRRRGRRRQGDAAKRRREESVSGAAPEEPGDAEAGETREERPSIEHTGDEPDGGSPTAETPAVEAVPVQKADAQASDPEALEAPVSAAPPEPAPAAPAASEPVTAVETPTEPIADHSGLESASPPSVEPTAHGETTAEPEPTQPAPIAASVPEQSAAESRDVHASEPAADEAPAVVSRTQPQEGDDDEHEDDEADDEDDSEDDDSDDEEHHVEQLGGDAMEEVPYRPVRQRRHYKIQEVIKRRQVLLVQVVKEERGTKGAALTTYLSLAGRYSVLMPNTARGGGISRKITDSTDRKRLKSIAEELEVPEGMGIILRTAGASRTKPEVKRDFEYLLRMWETVREVTLGSTAPTLVYEEGSLIKRAIRDLYNKDVEEILVAGDDGYKEAKDFMRLLMPSHAKSVQHYHEAQPIFAAAGAEAQLDGMYFNQVTLRSGGYIVINQTEALVAIDVNSGRSTREHNIEDTALRTNLEAADEVARQLRLRDLAGLIVVDFIDMEEGRNNRAVERRMKEALKNDRARIQIGRISHFGLLEMSRQRIRTGVLEGSTVPCPHCMGSGMLRSTASIALHVLRGLEEALIKNPNYDVTVRTRTEVALYILNQKREHLRELEERFGLAIALVGDSSMSGVTYFAVDRGESATQRAEARPRRDLVRVDSVRPIHDDEEDDAEGATDGEEEVDGEEEAETGDEPAAARAPEDRAAADAGRRRRRRRRGGRDRDSGDSPAPAPGAPQPSDDGLAVVMEIAGDQPSRRRDAPSDGEGDEQQAEDGDEAATDDQAQRGRSTTRRRRRSRRGGEQRRGNRRSDQEEAQADRGEFAGGWSETDAAHEAIGLDAEGTTAEPAGDIAAHGTRDDHHDRPAPEHHDGDRMTADPGAAASAPQAEPRSVPIAEPATAATEPPHDGEGTPRDAEGTPRDAEGTPRDAAGTPLAVAAAADPEPAAGAPAPQEETEARPKIDVHASVPTDDEQPRPKRSGWWQRAKATFGG